MTVPIHSLRSSCIHLRVMGVAKRTSGPGPAWCDAGCRDHGLIVILGDASYEMSYSLPTSAMGNGSSRRGTYTEEQTRPRSIHSRLGRFLMGVIESNGMQSRCCARIWSPGST